MFQFRLLGQRIERRLGQHVGAQALEKAVAPVHGHIRLATADRLIGHHRDDQAAAAAAHLEQIAALQATPAQFVRMQAEQRFRCVAEQLRGRAGAAHAVPLITQAAGVEGQGITRLAFFLGRAKRLGLKLRAAVCRGELAIAIQARSTLGSAGRERPLLGTLVIQNRVAQPGKVEIAFGSQVFVFLEQRVRAVEGEQAGQAGA